LKLDKYMFDIWQKQEHSSTGEESSTGIKNRY